MKFSEKKEHIHFVWFQMGTIDWYYLCITTFVHWNVSLQMRWTFCRSFLFSCWAAVTPPWPLMTTDVQSCRWDGPPLWLSHFDSSFPMGMHSSTASPFSMHFKLLSRVVTYWSPGGLSGSLQLLISVYVKICRSVQLAAATGESSARWTQCLHHSQPWGSGHTAAKDQFSCSCLHRSTAATPWVSLAFFSCVFTPFKPKQ